MSGWYEKGELHKENNHIVSEVNFALKEYVKRCKQGYKDSTND